MMKTILKPCLDFRNNGGVGGVICCGLLYRKLLTTSSNSRQAQGPPRVSPHYCFAGALNFPQWEGSAVIHRKKNDLLYKLKKPLVCITAMPSGSQWMCSCPAASVAPLSVLRVSFW